MSRDASVREFLRRRPARPAHSRSRSRRWHRRSLQAACGALSAAPYIGKGAGNGWSFPLRALRKSCARHRINDKYPAGVVTLEAPPSGSTKRRLSISRATWSRLRNRSTLNRIMAIDKGRSDKLVITMTDVHLPSAHRHCRSSRLSRRPQAEL
jgi:hypothetical protein